MIIMTMGKLALVQSLEGHRGKVWNVCWHFGGKSLASCGEDKVIRIWEERNDIWSLTTVLSEGHKRTIREVSWSPCGNLLAAASFDSTVSIWGNLSGHFECLTSLEGHESEVKSVDWSKSGDLLATCSRDKSVWIWERNGEEYECASFITQHSQDVKKVRWHPHKDILASASYDDTVKIFVEDPIGVDWNCEATLSSHTSTVWSLSFDSTGSRLVTCSDDRTIKIWQEYKPDANADAAIHGKTPVWKCVSTISGHHTRAIFDVDWCKKSGLIATACGDNKIRIFKETDGSDPNEPNFQLVCCEENSHSLDVNSVQWNPNDPRYLASAGDDGKVNIWLYSD